MNTRSIAFLTTLYFIVGSAALAIPPISTPEVDPSSLGALASGITAAFIAYRMFRAGRARK